MKKIVPSILFFTIFLFADGISQNRSISFNDKPFDDILAMAKKENKLVFMDAFATWCGPCKWMSANIFTNDTVADFYNKNFICVKYDMEKGEGLKLRERYQVRAYPTLLFINADGVMVHLKVGGAQNIHDYIALGKRAMDPSECFAAYAKRYAGGENSPVFIYDYFKMLLDAYIPVDIPLNKYLSSQKESDLSGNANWKIIYAYCDDMDSREFKFLLAHQDEFVFKHGKDSVDTKIYTVYLKSLVKLSRSVMMGDSTYSRLKHEIIATGYSGAGRVIFDADMNLYEMQGNAQKFMELIVGGLDKYYYNDPAMLNSSAWMIHDWMTHENPKNINYLEKALQWAKRAVELKSDASNNDTYGALLYDLGKKDEAIRYCKLALDLARKNSLPTETIEDNLKKYESGL